MMPSCIVPEIVAKNKIVIHKMNYLVGNCTNSEN